jgi:uncharacterized protein YdeI (YjbR/CyaY-like superfamily)
MQLIMEPKYFYPRDRKEWRDWLQKNHKTERAIYFVRYKNHTGKPSISHRIAMDEAICFGWIDTTVKRIDEERSRICFMRRNEKSRWSTSTQRHARRLIKERLMTPEGLKFYKMGLKKPVIDHGLPRDPETPKDLEKAFTKKSREFFHNLAPSYKRTFIYWVVKAKLPETKKKRIEIVVKCCEQGKKSWM